MLSRDVSQQLLGIIGCIHVARFGWLFVELTPRFGLAALVYLLVAIVAVVPALGLVAHKPLGRTWWVSAFVVDALITLALVL